MQDEMGSEGLRGKKQSQRDKFEGGWLGALHEPRSKGHPGGDSQRNQGKKENKMLGHRLCWLIGKF